MCKRILFAALACLVSFSAAAQDEGSGGVFSTTVFLGMNVTKVHKNLLYDRAKKGASLGVKFDYILPKAHGTYLSVGLDWTQKGAKGSVLLLADDNEAARLKLSLHYLEIPLHVGFLRDFSSRFALYAETGPYVAVGVGGKSKLDIEAEGEDWDELEDELCFPIFGKDKQNERYQFRRFDAGLGFRVGAEFHSHYNVMLGCDWGLVDMWRKDYLDSVIATGGKLNKCRNISFTVAVGYRF